MLRIIDPSTEELLHELEEDTAGSLNAKVERARRAQRSWQRVPLAQRSEAVRRCGEALGTQRERLASTLTAEMGKPIVQSRNELNAMADRIAFFLEATPAAIAEDVVLRSVTGGTSLEERIRYEPLGVIANISAWN